MTDTMAIFAVLGFVVALIIWFQTFAINSRLRKLSRIETKLDLLLKHAVLEYDPLCNLADGVLRALARRQENRGLKEYRAQTGAGLAEAKDFIEEVQKLGKY